MRISKKLSIVYREARFVVQGLLSTDYPLVAHLVCTRRCNLACAYCNEYDHVSAPVPAALLLDRIDRLARLRTAAVVFTGGEPLLHPELERFIAHARSKGMLAGAISNCFLLTPSRVEQLNHAGLDYLQVSIDSEEPNGRSVKSLYALEPKLRMLATAAQFRVHLNSVLGGGHRESGRSRDRRTIRKVARLYQFSRDRSQRTWSARTAECGRTRCVP